MKSKTTRVDLGVDFGAFRRPLSATQAEFHFLATCRHQHAAFESEPLMSRAAGDESRDESVAEEILVVAGL